MHVNVTIAHIIGIFSTLVEIGPQSGRWEEEDEALCGVVCNGAGV